MMTRTTSDIKRDRLYSGAMHEPLAPAGFLGTGAVYTKSGDLFHVLRVRGVDTECLEPSAVADVATRFDAALRILGPEYRVYQYMVKRDSPDVLSPDPANAWDDLLHADREEWLQFHRRELYSIHLYMVVLRMRQSLVNATDSIGTTTKLMRSAVEHEAHLLELDTQSLITQLEDSVAPEPLMPADTIDFLRSLVNLDPDKAKHYGSIPAMNLDQYLCVSEILCHRTNLEQDGYHSKILSMVDPPNSTYPHILRDLLAIKSNMIVCSEWNRIDNEATISEIDTHHGWFNSQRVKVLGRLFNKDPKPHEINEDGSQKELVDVMDQAKTEIVKNQKFFGRFSFRVAIFDQSLQNVEKAESKVRAVFGQHDSRLITEGLGLVEAWAALVPGGYRHVTRKPMWMINDGHADLSPGLFAPATGSKVNPHLRRSALAVLETEAGTPYWFNSQVEDVGHLSALGATGSGKTFLMKFLISCYQQYDPFTAIFDVMGNYKSLTEHYDGGYLDIGGESKVAINPFSLPNTKENRSFLHSFLRVLIGGAIEPEQATDLDECIQAVYSFPEQSRTLKNFADTLHRSYRPRLDPWVGSGRFAEYFDNAVDTLTMSKFQTYNFRGLEQSQKEVLEPVLFYILHRATNRVRSFTARPKILVWDEAWKFFKHPITSAYIHEALKTLRNFNASVWLATQSENDLRKSEMLDTIKENCPTKLFLANPGMDVRQYAETFNLNPRTAELISKLRPKGQFMLAQPTHQKVINFLVDPAAREFFSQK